VIAFLATLIPFCISVEDDEGVRGEGRTATSGTHVSHRRSTLLHLRSRRGHGHRAPPGTYITNSQKHLLFGNLLLSYACSVCCTHSAASYALRRVRRRRSRSGTGSGEHCPARSWRRRSERSSSSPARRARTTPAAGSAPAPTSPSSWRRPCRRTAPAASPRRRLSTSP
jgi:hypothetical protein